MRKTAILILVLLALSLTMVVVDRLVGLGLAKGALAWLLRPLQQGLDEGGDQTRTLWERWQECGQLQEENDGLREMVDYLTLENRRLEEALRENEQLRQLLGLPERYADLKLLAAEVIGRDPNGLQQVLRVGWGTVGDQQVEVRQGMAVISAAGLVGRVVEVYPDAADVLLITDISSSISAVCQNEDHPTGIVDGRWQAGTRLIMRYLPQGTVVQEGDWVMTSGLQLYPLEEKAFPPGIPIGRVLRTETAADLHQQVELIPAVDFDHLEYVMIVLGSR